jgi:hypothetical protein
MMTCPTCGKAYEGTSCQDCAQRSPSLGRHALNGLRVSAFIGGGISFGLYVLFAAGFTILSFLAGQGLGGGAPAILGVGLVVATVGAVAITGVLGALWMLFVLVAPSLGISIEG